MTQEQCIEELEWQNRRFRCTGAAVLMTVLGALVVCAGLLATGCAVDKDAAQPKVVTGTEFRLVDDKGATRAVLAMENGHPLLRFLDERGKYRASIGLQEYGPSMFFARDNGKPGASIGVGPMGPAMAFGDSAGNVRFMLTVDETGTPKMVLKDTTGHVAWTAP